MAFVHARGAWVQIRVSERVAVASFLFTSIVPGLTVASR